MKKIILVTLITFLVTFSLIPWGLQQRFAAEALEAHKRSQVLLARQSANTLEALYDSQLASGSPVLSKLLERTAATLPAEMVELGLFDLETGKMLHVTSGASVEDYSALHERLLRGGFGHFVQEGVTGKSLITFLPLTLGENQFALLLATPVAKDTRLLILAGAQSAMALVLALGLGWGWQRRRSAHAPLQDDAANDKCTPSGDRTEAEMNDRSEALRLENLTLQSRLWDYQLLVDSADYGMARLGGNAQIQFSSLPFQKLIGQRGHELKGRNLLDLEVFDKPTRQRLQEAVGEIRSGGAATTIIVEMPTQKRGKNTLFSLRLVRLQGNEAANGLLLTAHPVAEAGLPQAFVS